MRTVEEAPAGAGRAPVRAGGGIHHGKRYEWSQGDVVLVHNDSVHQHFNPYDEPAMTLVIKAKPTWMFLGLTAPDRETAPERLEGFGRREDWSQLWTPRATELKKNPPREGRAVVPVLTARATAPRGAERVAHILSGRLRSDHPL